MLLYVSTGERTIGEKARRYSNAHSKITEKVLSVYVVRRIRVNVLSNSVDLKTSFPALTNALQQQKTILQPQGILPIIYNGLYGEPPPERGTF